jgi:hypothetical protein
MSFVLYNPHRIWFFKPVRVYLEGKRAIGKYDYIFNFIYNTNEKIYVLIDKKFKSNSFKTLRFFNTYKLEFKLWCLLNELDYKKFIFINSLSSFNSNDSFFTFYHGNFNVNNIELEKDLKEAKLKKIIHMSHYAYNIKIGSESLKNSNIDLLLYESNLNQIKFFKEHFSWFKGECQILPFIPSNRFKVLKPFKLRKNFCLASGSIVEVDDIYFSSFFNTKYLQPFRKVIYEKRSSIKKYNIFQVLLYDLKSIMIILKKTLGFKVRDYSHDRSYYKLNIVDLFNDYKFSLIPEEIIGTPGISFVESMSCGNLYFGVIDHFYEDIGLISGIHYVSYDGSLEDLIIKIKYYQANLEEAEEIANNGLNFVKENFTVDKSIEILKKYIK